jgi:hypothetical protein
MDKLRDWITTFWSISIRPAPKTFVVESAKAKGKLPGVIAWLELISVIGCFDYFLVIRRSFSLSTFLLGIFFLPVEFFFFVFCIHMLYQRLFGRKKNYYTELLYLIVGIFVPFTIISFIVSPIPVVGTYLSWTISLYPLVLTMIAVMSITKLNAWQSVAVVLLSSVLAAAGLFCIPAFFLSIMRTVPTVF